jgi:hypothetical protein
MSPVGATEDFSTHRSPMTANQSVTVFGAYRHTGRFVVSELRESRMDANSLLSRF